MELTAELLGAGAVGVIVAIGAIGNYLRSLKAKPDSTAPMLAGIGFGYVEREQMERLISEVKRIADIMSDKNTAGINDQLEEQAERIESLMKMLENKTVPPRRR